MTTHKTDRTAQNFASFMIRRAIAYFQDADARAQALIRRDPSLGRVGRPDETSVSERTAQGVLRCHARPGPVTADGEQLFRTRFSLEGTAISRVDAEAVLAGARIETASQDIAAGVVA